MPKDINIVGGKELADALRQLPIKIEKKLMRAAMRQGANEIKDEAKRLVSVKDGDLRKSIKVSTNSRRGNVEAKVKAGSRKAYYYHFVEFGTAMHVIKPKNKASLKFFANGGVVTTGRVLHTGAKAKPYMRPALDNKADDAVFKIGTELRRRMKEVI